MIIILFILGLSVGSFLNVVIDRLPAGESVICGRSHCDKCRKILAWYDLIPLVSLLMLHGKCRYCSCKLSYQYPLIELLTALSFAWISSFFISDSFLFHDSVRFIYILIFISCMIAIFFTDLKYRIIPDQILFMLGIITLFYLLFIEKNPIFLNICASLLSGGLFLFLIIITRGRGMGMGDVKYAFIMGMILGLPKIIVGLYLAFLTGGVISIILIFAGIKKMKSTLPFGPFLVLGTVVTFFWGEYLWIFTKRLMGI